MNFGYEYENFSIFWYSLPYPPLAMKIEWKIYRRRRSWAMELITSVGTKLYSFGETSYGRPQNVTKTSLGWRP